MRAQPEILGCGPQFCLTIKNFLAWRYAKPWEWWSAFCILSGLQWPAPAFSTVCRRQRGLQGYVLISKIQVN